MEAGILLFKITNAFTIKESAYLYSSSKILQGNFHFFDIYLFLIFIFFILFAWSLPYFIICKVHWWRYKDYITICQIVCVPVHPIHSELNKGHNDALLALILWCPDVLMFFRNWKITHYQDWCPRMRTILRTSNYAFFNYCEIHSLKRKCVRIN